MSAADKIAFASMFVGACALAISFWQGFVAQRHAKLSSRPIIEAEAHAHKNPGVSIINVGLGPARLTALVARLEAETLDLLTDAGQGRLTELLVSDPTAWLTVEHYVPRGGAVIAAGQTLHLLRIPAAEGNGPLSRDLARTFRKMTLIVEYKSIYDETLSAVHEFRDPQQPSGSSE